jgi:hypothetical protein
MVLSCGTNRLQHRTRAGVTSIKIFLRYLIMLLVILPALNPDTNNTRITGLTLQLIQPWYWGKGRAVSSLHCFCDWVNRL